MPCIHVRALSPSSDTRKHDTLYTAASALSQAIGTPLAAIQAVWEPVEISHMGGEDRHFFLHRPVVTIRARAGRTDAQIAAALEAVARAVSDALGLAVEDIWVDWEDMAPGRLFLGGELR